MRKAALICTLTLSAALGACTKTGEGEYKVKTPDVDVNTKETTINTPVVGTKKDTLIVDRPTAGTKKTEVKVPTVDVKGPNENKHP